MAHDQRRTDQWQQAPEQHPPPPPPGAAPLDYRPPGAAEPERVSTSQAVFDTVAGPNLRAKDNLIQLAVVGVGTFLGVVVGWFVGEETGVLVGALIGLTASLLLSGLVIGIIRLMRPGRK